MTILVNGKEAVVDSDLSFDYVIENRMFSNSDEFSLSIKFPLRGCARNVELFGFLHEHNSDISEYVFDCTIMSGQFVKTGSLIISEIDESSVTCQFLLGRSADNYKTTLDTIYINELTLGYGLHQKKTDVSDPEVVWQGSDYVALPWVNNYSGNIQNYIAYDSSTDSYAYCNVVSSRYQRATGYRHRGGEYSDGSRGGKVDARTDKYDNDVVYLSYQPYLVYIVEQICSAIGYTIDTSWWRSSKLKYLLLCNALPAAWDIFDFGRALPHWTVQEFFEELEKLLNIQFSINHASKHIDISFANVNLLGDPQELECVFDAFSTDVDYETDSLTSNSRLTNNVSYDAGDNRMWDFWSCPELVKDFPYVLNFGHTADFENWLSDKKHIATWFYDHANYLINLRTEDFRRYVLFAVALDQASNGKYWYRTRLYDVNIFSPLKRFEQLDSEVSLKCVPCWIDETDEEKGDCLFLEFADFNESKYNIVYNGRFAEPYNPSATNVAYSTVEDFDDSEQNFFTEVLTSGYDSGLTEYYDKLYLGWWDGTSFIRGKYPFPLIDQYYYDVDHQRHVYDSFYDFRLDAPAGKGINVFGVDGFSYDLDSVFQFSFLTDKIYDVHRPFLIDGKLYLAKKLTYTVTKDGLSKKVKGEFYRITNL